MTNATEVPLRLHHVMKVYRARNESPEAIALASVIAARKPCDLSKHPREVSEHIERYYDYFGTTPPSDSMARTILLAWKRLDMLGD